MPRSVIRVEQRAEKLRAARYRSGGAAAITIDGLPSVGTARQRRATRIVSIVSRALMLTFNRSSIIPVDLEHEGVMNKHAKADVMQGTLDVMVLKTLDTLDPTHGYGIARRAGAGLERPAASQSRHDLPGARPSPAAGVDHLALGRERQQAPREILRAHARRAETSRRRNRKVGARLVGREPVAHRRRLRCLTSFN